MTMTLQNLWRQNRYFLLFIVLLFCFRSAIADWNDVPTGSMQPTIVEGDRIFVNKMAYDLRVPFTPISLYRRTNPNRGDIVVFDSERSEQRLVKRVIGIPGDTVSMTNNRLTINAQPLQYDNLDNSNTDQVEDLLGLKHMIRTNSQRHYRQSSFAAITVPEDHYLVLGDNRDNSADSRFIGFVPRKEIVGRATRVVVSFDYDNYYLPRGERLLKAL